MTVDTQNFTTGPSTLPDVGTLFYNGVTFSPLYETQVSGKAVMDEAQRTVMYMEYTLIADGYVTLPDGAADTDGVMTTLKRLLTKQAGELRYIGRGNDIEVNVPGSANKDVKWGPRPKILDFQPLGGGRSAKIKWIVEVAVVEQGFELFSDKGGFPGGGDPKGGDPPGNEGALGGNRRDRPIPPGPSKDFRQGAL